MQRDLLGVLSGLREKDAYPLLRDLLNAMSYQQVAITHGPLEDGRDLVFMEEDRFRRQLWRGLQVKSEPPTGSLTSPNGLRSIISQCEAALEKPYLTAAGEKVSLREIWLVFTNPLSEAAKRSAQELIQRTPLINLLDAPHLADLITTYLPDLLDHGSPLETYITNLATICDSLDEYIYSRLSARFTLKMVFVQPEAQLSLISPDALMGALPLPEALGLLQVRENFEEQAVLALSRLLPAYEAAPIVQTLTQVGLLLRSLKAMGDLMPDNIPLDEFIALCSSVGYTVASDGWDRLEPNEDNRKPLDRGLLQTLEDELIQELSSQRGPAKTAIEPLFLWKRQSLQRMAEAEERRLRARRERCLELLGKAYRYSTDLKDPMTQVAKVASKILSTKLVENRELTGLAVEATGRLDRIISFIADFDRDIRAAYKILWQKGQIGTLRHRRGPVLEDSLPDNFEVVASLSSFFQAYYAIQSETSIQLPAVAKLMLQRFPRIIVKGELGMGKTTLLKQHALEVTETRGSDENAKIPAFCSLSTIKKVSGFINWPILLAEAAKASFRDLDNIKSKSVVWLLDGYDEMESNSLRARLLDWCCSRSIDYGKVIVSSRPNAVPGFFPGFIPIRLLPLSGARLNELIEKYFGDRTDEGRRLQGVIKGSEELKGLARNPLMATLLVILAREIGADHVPRRREQVYDRILRLLLGEWDSAKGLVRVHEVEEADVRLLILKKVAYRLHLQTRRAFSSRDFIDNVSQAGVEPRLSVGAMTHLFHDFLRDCLITPLTPDNFCYFHFSMQEFLAAREMADDIIPNKVRHAIKEYFGAQGSWWEEPLVFYAGIKRDVSALINEMSNNLTGRNDRQARLAQRLIKRWFEVADFTRSEDLQPRGLIAEVMADLNVLGARSQWESCARLPV